MRYTRDAKQDIIIYILNKIAEGTTSISKVVSENLQISPNTVHNYLNALLEKGIIVKSKRGQYDLVTTHHTYHFTREDRALVSDTEVYEKCLAPLLADAPENVKHIWAYALSEMVNNVIDHSGTQRMGIYIEHNYLNTRVAVVDSGVGIFGKIMDHFGLPDLETAICELFKGKLTTDAENHSGEGIFFSSKMMDTFLIISSGKVFATTKYNEEATFDDELGGEGTCVVMSLSNFSNRSAKEVFDQYSNDEGAFATTRIPIKNIFDSAPISRSQAKRICERLDKFEKVILDFDGVGWMGQGFAHQLFVVFQNAHPEVTLLPENMDESVESMYRHVVTTV